MKMKINKTNGKHKISRSEKKLKDLKNMFSFERTQVGSQQKIQ
jgi:hypothetical protein